MKTAGEFKLKAQRANLHADMIDRKLLKEYILTERDKLYLESNRARSSAKRWLRRAFVFEALAQT